MYELTSVRTTPSADGSHEHVELVGYASPHMPTEAIMIPWQRVLQRQALGEKFWVDAEGEKADVDGGACPVCAEPTLVSSADGQGKQILLSLPRE